MSGAASRFKAQGEAFDGGRRIKGCADGGSEAESERSCCVHNVAVAGAEAAAHGGEMVARVSGRGALVWREGEAEAGAPVFGIFGVEWCGLRALGRVRCLRCGGRRLEDERRSERDGFDHQETAEHEFDGAQPVQYVELARLLDAGLRE